MDHAEEFAVFCENIRRLRTRHGLSKQEMAKRLEIGVYSLSLLEHDILPKRLGCNVIYTIYRQFGIAPDNMFTTLVDRS